jgi:putative ABC transport system substrate-binding protein
MRRREFITILGSAAAGAGMLPTATQAQQRELPVVGYLYAGTSEASAPLLSAFLGGLKEAGYIDGQNVTIEYRWARNENARLAELAADLVQRRVAVIAALASPAAINAAKAATKTIPIVFSIGSDPVQLGLVGSLNRPGANITGVTSLNVDVSAKRIELLRELVPTGTRYALLVNPHNQLAASTAIDEMRKAASAIEKHIEVFTARTRDEIDGAFADLLQSRPDGLLVSPGTPFNENREKLIGLASRHRLPTIYASRQFVAAGGLISYGAVLTEEFRLAGNYTGRILKGDKPAEMPVMRAAKFELVLNVKTAADLGVLLPPTLLARADEVIE